MSENNFGEVVLYYWNTGRKTRHTPSGWLGGNAVCCAHRGHSADRRGRGGVITKTDGSFAYSCFNCGYSASWEPGRLLNNRVKQLLEWLNVPEDDIRRLALHALKLSDQSSLNSNGVSIPQFHTVSLPPDSRKIDEGTPVEILEYIMHRDLEPFVDQFYYSMHTVYKNRIIIPFRYYNRIVGWTARKVEDDDSPKYLTEQQPGYVYGLERQSFHDQFVLVTEGPVDAMHIKGVAVMGSDVNHAQLELIRNLNRPIILVPDRDPNGDSMVNWFLDKECFVSFPQWDSDIKDVSDAVNRYGRLATFASIINGICTTRLKAQLKQRKWFTNGD